EQKPIHPNAMYEELTKQIMRKETSDLSHALHKSGRRVQCRCILLITLIYVATFAEVESGIVVR
ncbi:MAG: hypothetical protein ACFCU6_16005, partial [Balneolaceae bacterium]